MLKKLQHFFARRCRTAVKKINVFISADNQEIEIKIFCAFITTIFAAHTKNHD